MARTPQQERGRRRRGDGGDDETRRRRPAVVGVERFANSGSRRKASEAARARKRKRFAERAATFRTYRKAMKKEGYETRSRGPRDRPTDDDEAPPSRRGRPLDPFAEAKQKAEAAREEREKERGAREEREREIARKAKERKRRTRALTQRTKKGQPIMKNVVCDLLEKIQKDVMKES